MIKNAKKGSLQKVWDTVLSDEKGCRFVNACTTVDFNMGLAIEGGFKQLQNGLNRSSYFISNLLYEMHHKLFL